MPLGVEPRGEDGGAEIPLPEREIVRAELWSVTVSVTLPALVSSRAAEEEFPSFAGFAPA